MSVLDVIEGLSSAAPPLLRRCAGLESRLAQLLHSAHLWAPGGLLTGTDLGQPLLD